MSAILDDILLRAGLAGLGVALIAGPLGCFILWRRLAYFGEASAHAALLGVALGLLMGAPVWLGALAVSAAMALVVARAGLFSAGRATQGQIAGDGMIGVYAHGALAAGLVALSQMPGAPADPSRYLFGEILGVRISELALIWGAATALGLAMVWRWSALLNATLSPEMALAEGGAPDRESLGLTLAIAVTIALAMQVVGLLLVISLMILPAAAARALSSTPEAMALWSAALGAGAVALGLAGSFNYDAPSGPSIVLAAFALFCFATLAGPAIHAGIGRPREGEHP
ncbi:MAG: metal ABC transporter permease [Pseudomonadota bacterium]